MKIQMGLQFTDNTCKKLLAMWLSWGLWKVWQLLVFGPIVLIKPTIIKKKKKPDYFFKCFTKHGNREFQYVISSVFIVVYLIIFSQKYSSENYM